MSLLQRSILRLPPSGSWPQYDNDPESPWHDAEAIAAYHDTRTQAEEDLAAEGVEQSVISKKIAQTKSRRRVRDQEPPTSRAKRDSLVVKLASHLGVKSASMHRRTQRTSMRSSDMDVASSRGAKTGSRASVAPLDKRPSPPAGVEPLVRAMESRGKVRAKTVRARVEGVEQVFVDRGRDGNASETRATAKAQHRDARVATRDEVRAVYPEVGRGCAGCSARARARRPHTSLCGDPLSPFVSGR